MVTVTALMTCVVWIIVAGLIFWLLNWLIGYAGIPEPFNKFARVVLAIFAVLVIINALMGMMGRPLVIVG